MGRPHNLVDTIGSKMCRPNTSTGIVILHKPSTQHWINDNVERNTQNTHSPKSVYRLDSQCLSEIETSMKMVMGWKTVVLVSVAAWTVGWLLNTPVPQGYHDPWTYRGTTGVLKIMRLTEWVKGHFCSLEDLMVSFRQYDSFPNPPMDYPVKTHDTTFDGVAVRVYRPEGLPDNNIPAIVFYHGGGWIMGSVDEYHSFSIALAHEVQALVVSVEYRLSPEHRFPASLDDCVAATKYFLQETEQFGVDPGRVAIAGDSAGGNLAAAVAIVLRDQQFSPQPKLQVLIYPMTQPINFNTPSFQANRKNPILPAQLVVTAWLLYANVSSQHLQDLMDNKHTSPAIKRELYSKQLDTASILETHKDPDYKPNRVNFGDEALWHQVKAKFTNPYMAPLMVKDVRGLPEALVFSVEQDVLRDDGLLYVEHLRTGGVSVLHQHYKAGFHGIMSTVSEQRNNVEARKKIYLSLKRRL